jgi:DNA-binding HxlR family transcriptional regulator
MKEQNSTANNLDCFSIGAAKLLQGKWRLQILCTMTEGSIRLGQLQRLIPTASKKVLAENLRAMVKSGLLIRKNLSGNVLHVEYRLPETLATPLRHVIDVVIELDKVYKANKARSHDL